MDNPKHFYLEIITPTKQFYTGPAQALILPAVDGQMGVYTNHEPVVTAIEPGQLYYQVDEDWEHVVVGAGFAEIKPDCAILLVSTAERPEEIDFNRAQEAKKRALELLSTQIILVHNHPSGSAEPSGQDKVLTQKIARAAALFDIRLLDHLIISSEGDFSFRQAGLLY